MFNFARQAFRLIKIGLLLVCFQIIIFAQTETDRLLKQEEKPKTPVENLTTRENNFSSVKDQNKKFDLKDNADNADIADNTDTGDIAEGKNELSLWGGFSPDSTRAINFGQYEDARYGIIGLRYARRFNNNDTVNLKYTADIIPVAILNFPVTRAIRIPPNPPRLETFRRTGYAFGAVPLGLQANFRPRKKIQPFVNAGAGILYFNKNIPNEFGKRLNFILEAGGGIEFKTKNNKAITVGYKLSHISNAYRGDFNPGFDNNIFYLGYTFFNK